MKFAEAQSRYQALLANGFKMQTIEYFFTEVFVDSELSLEDKFNLIKGHSSIGNDLLYPLIMNYVRQCIKLNDMLQNPTDFFIQLQNNKKIFEGILFYIPSDRYDSSLKLLAFAMRWYKKLSANLRNIKLLPHIHKAIKGSDEMMLYLEDTFKIDQQITITELNLLIAWLEFFALYNAPIIKSIEITRDLNDLELILALTKLLKFATVLKFQECHISVLCLQKMAQVQSQMGDIYPIKNVFISKISLDKHCLGQLKNWLGEKFSILNLTIEEDGPCTLSGLNSDIAHYLLAEVVLSNYINAEKLNSDCELLLKYLRNGCKTLKLQNCIKHGLSISDPNITDVIVSDFQIVRGIQENPSLLTFLASLPNLSFLTIKNNQLFAVELKQLLNNVRVSQFTWDAPINNAQLDLIIEELANNKTLTTLSLPQGNFNRTSLLKLAQVLRESNNFLAYLKLPENIDIPNELEIELKKNRQRPELQRDYEIAQKQIRQIIQFASSSNPNIPGVSYCFGHNLNDMWAAAGVAYDRCMKWMDHKCSRDFKISELIESLAIGYSYLLAQSQTSQRTELIWYSSKHFKLLQDLLPHIKNPQAQIIFYQNIYLFCKSYYQALLNTTVVLDKKETTDDRYVMEYLMQCDNLQMVLMCIPSANNLFYREVNEMLFAVLQRKILVTIANVPPSDDISLLCKNIKVATDIRDLLSCVNNFLEYLPLTDKLRLQYWMNFNNNLEPRAAAIVKLNLARSNIHEIYNVRRNPIMDNSQQIISLEKLQPIPTLDLAPPATFVGKVDKGESEKIENHSESNSQLLPPPLVPTLQPTIVPSFVSPPAPPVTEMSIILSTAQSLPQKDDLNWLGLEDDINSDEQSSNLNYAEPPPNSPYQEITIDEATVQSVTLNIEDTPTTQSNELKSESDEEQEAPINIRNALQFMTLGNNLAPPPQPLTLPAAPTHEPEVDEQKDHSQQHRREKTLAS